MPASEDSTAGDVKSPDRAALNRTHGPRGLSPHDLFARKWELDPATGCHIWRAALSAGGYGQHWLGGRNRRAHQAAWELARGPIPAGLCVCHKCDNRRCVNVEHLFLGTHKENTADMFAKGRGPSTMERIRSVRRNERHPRARLTDAQIDEIRARYAAGGVSQRALAREFGVYPGHVSYIVRFRRRAPLALALRRGRAQQ